MENKQVNSTAKRTVTLYSTRDGMKKVQTNVTSWGELKHLVEAHYDLSNLQATEGTNKTTLEHVWAKLPEGDFTLFLRPIRTKSGAIGFQGRLDDDVKYISQEEAARLLGLDPKPKSSFDASGYDDPIPYDDDEDEDSYDDEDLSLGEDNGIDEQSCTSDVNKTVNKVALHMMQKVYATGRQWADIGMDLFKAGMSYYRDIEEAEQMVKERLAEQLRSIEDGLGSDGGDAPALSPEEQRLEEMMESLERGF